MELEQRVTAVFKAFEGAFDVQTHVMLFTDQTDKICDSLIELIRGNYLSGGFLGLVVFPCFHILGIIWVCHVKCDAIADAYLYSCLY